MSNHHFNKIDKELENKLLQLEQDKQQLGEIHIDDGLSDDGRVFDQVAHNRKIATYSTMVSLSLVILLIFGIYLVNKIANKPDIMATFGIAANGTAIVPVPVNVKNKSNAELLEWVGNKAMDIQRVSFMDYETRVNSWSDFMTERAHNNWRQTLIDSGRYEQIKGGYLSSFSKNDSAPKIIDTNERTDNASSNEALWWEIEFYQELILRGGDAKPSTTSVKTILKVIRVPETVNPDGLMIDETYDIPLNRGDY